MNRLTELAMVCLLASAMPAAVFAQSAAEEAPPPKFIFGPLGLTPRIALRNVGVDTNPLNRAGEQERDFTATIVPGVDSTLRMGRGRLTAKTSVEYVHFNRYRSERSANLNQEARADLFLNRLAPYVFGSYLRTRERPNTEIDARVQQNSTSGGLGTALRVGTRFRFEVEARRSRFDFGAGKHGVQAIADALDHDANVGSLVAKVTLTPLTTFVVRSDVQQDRFRVSSFRNSNSFSLVPGFELKPAALIAGKVSVGFRRFNAVDAAVSDFSGVVGRTEASYLWRESTQFVLLADRNIEYSIDEVQPYFVSNNGLLSVIQSIGGDWYVVGRLGESRLNYQDYLSSSIDSRVDRLLRRGLGLGRRLGTDIRVGFDVDYVRRRSNRAVNAYQGYRVGGSISYGS